MILIKMAEWYKYLIQFIIGGIIIAGTGYLAENLSTKAAAIFWAMPITLIPIILFLYYENKTPIKTLRNLLIENIPSISVLLLWVLILYFLLAYFSFWISLGVSFVCFGILAGIYWMVFCPSPFKNGSCIKITK